jgi:hypothetical protein
MKGEVINIPSGEWNKPLSGISRREFLKYSGVDKNSLFWREVYHQVNFESPHTNLFFVLKRG